MRQFLPLTILFAVLALAGCSSDDGAVEEDVEYIERPVGLIYNLGFDELQQGNYRVAAAWFNEVERQHPYSQWATKAKLMAAFAHYKALRYDDAIESLDRFIELHPGNPDIAYAYYLRSLCSYEQIRDVRRDQQDTQTAMNELADVVRRFPGSAYARDAALKIDLARDHLAGKEMEIGRYYLKRREFNAAINRFQAVVRDYNTTSHTAEALHRLVESYTALGLRQEAEEAAAVLGHNYPDSPWYRDSYALLTEGSGIVGETAGFFSRAWNSFF